jgi:hypothetical protein
MTTKPKTFAFVLMPFSEKFSDVYELGIKPACIDAGAYCERVDEQIFVESILDRIYNQISKADLIISDMTDRNPNVFYETGYAHALNKRVILVTQNTEDIPFDLKHYPHIIYGGRIAQLKSQLEAKVRWCIDNPRKLLATSEVNLEFFINGVPLLDEPEIHIAVEGYYTFKIDFHNPALTTAEQFKLALLLPQKIGFEKPDIDSYALFPDGRYIYNFYHRKYIYPDGWDAVEFVWGLNRQVEELKQEMPVALRVFTEGGARTYSFVIKP